MFRSFSFGVAPAVALACVLTFPPSPATAAECSVPPGIFALEPALPRFLAALKSGEPVIIVALGDASTEGRAAGGADFSWPSQLGTALDASFPDAAVTIVNLGKGRQTAASAVARIGAEVLPLAPALVIWETGTVDAVRNIGPWRFRETLEAGLGLLRPAADVVFVDMQFSRRTHAIIDFEPYARALGQVADLNKVPLFPRVELMRHWSETGEIDYAVQDKAKRRETARLLYRCIGRTLASFLTRSDREETRK